MNILFYSNPEEPVTEVLLKNQKELNLIPLAAQDLLQKGEIFDEIEQEKVTIRWELDQVGCVTNSSNTFLINRAFYCPEAWFEHFIEEDRKYAQSEFWAYLLFALNAFPNKIGAPGIGSLMENCLTLPMQWLTIQEGELDLRVPEYFLGDKNHIPVDWAKENIVFSHVYNFYNWRVLEKGEPISRNVFAFKKPLGKPILCFVIDQEVSLYPMLNGDELDLTENFMEKVRQTAYKVVNLLGYTIAEILFFIEQEKITFAMAYNIPYGAKQAPNFEEKLILGFRSILSKHRLQLNNC